MSQRARILLTGGTGFIGSALRGVLEGRGDEVIVVSRRGPVTWDAVDEQAGRVDAVVHLAGEPIAESRWTVERLERIRSSRVDTTRRLAVAMARAPRAKVFVSGSAVGIYGMRLDDVVCDESSKAGSDVLARIGTEWEAAAAPARDAGIRVTHPRIGIVLGRDGGALAKMRKPFELFAGGPLGTGRQWLSWIHVRDAVRSLVFAIDTATFSGPFNVVAPAPVTMNSFARALGEVLGRPSFFRVPALALRAALGDGVAELLLTGQRAIPRKLQAAGFRFDFPELDGALRDLK
jgi:uncharacterized protein (TIGR01777 family)